MKSINYTASKLSRSSRSIVKIGALAIFGLAALATAPKSDAQLAAFILTGDVSDTMVVSISSNNGTLYNSVSTGRYKVTFNGGAAVNGWCTDILHGISFGGGYTANVAFQGTAPIGTLNVNTNGYYQGGLASAIGNGDFTPVSTPPAAGALARAASASWLADTFLNTTSFTLAAGSADKNVNLSAIQVAIWDIVQDGGNGVGTGQGVILIDPSAAYANSTFAEMVTAVSYYEGQAASHTTYTNSQVNFIQAPTSQSGGVFTHNQDFLAKASVPEPGAVTLFIGTSVLGMMGMSLRKRAKK